MSSDFNYNKNNKQTFQRLKKSNLFQSIINQHPEEQENTHQINKINNKKEKTLTNLQQVVIEQKLNQQKYFRTLSKSQKKLQINLIYSQSEINNFMLQITRTIQKIQLQISEFCSKNTQRRAQLSIYVSKLSQLIQLLKSSIGAQMAVKTYLIKQSIQLLRSIGKINKFQYQRLIKQINLIAGIQQRKKANKDIQLQEILLTKPSNICQNNSTVQYQQSINKSHYNSKTLKSTNFTNQNQSNCTNQNQSNLQSIQKSIRQSDPNAKRNQNLSDHQFEFILANVDKIHQNHLKTWQKHNQQLKQLQQIKNSIKIKYSNSKSKTFQNRRILLRSQSLHSIKNKSPPQKINLINLSIKNTNSINDYLMRSKSTRLTLPLTLSSQSENIKTKYSQQISTKLQKMQDSRRNLPQILTLRKKKQLSLEKKKKSSKDKKNSSNKIDSRSETKQNINKRSKSLFSRQKRSLSNQQQPKKLKLRQSVNIKNEQSWESGNSQGNYKKILNKQQSKKQNSRQNVSTKFNNLSKRNQKRLKL